MKILVDADACPVVRIVEQVAQENEIAVILVCDNSHIITTDYARVVIVDRGADAADFKLLSLTQPGDIVVTQDYGVAAMALGKGAMPIHQSGKRYSDENIDAMLMERHIAKCERRKSGKSHLKGPKKRNPGDDGRFEAAFRCLLMQCREGCREEKV